MPRHELPDEAVLRKYDNPVGVKRMSADKRPDGGEWGEPADLWNIESDPYPVHVFPSIARTAITEYQAYAKQPLPLGGGSALAQMALAAQGVADVARDERLVGPISLNQMALAESGERKSAADRQFGRGARAWQKEKREELLAEHRRAKAMAKDHRARMDGVKKKITTLAGKDDPSDQEEAERLQRRLIELEQNPIIVPPLPVLAYEDATPAALAYALAVGWPSAGLFSDEAGAVVGGHGLGEETATSYLALANILWDGRDYVPTRKVAEAAELRGRRFSVFLMMQPELLKHLIDKGARSIGFLARFLLSAPKTTKGTRLYSVPPSTRGQDAFDARIKLLLDMDLPIDKSGDDRGLAMRLKPPVMHLEDSAKALWIEFHDSVERELHPFGEFAPVADVASKAAENAVRIAAVFQIFDQTQVLPYLRLQFVEAGIALAGWHLTEALRIFFQVDATQEMEDARMLSEWLVGMAPNVRDSGGKPIMEGSRLAAREILRCGPYRLRDRDRRDAALKVLGETDVQHAIVRDSGRRKDVFVNPKLLNHEQK